MSSEDRVVNSGSRWEAFRRIVLDAAFLVGVAALVYTVFLAPRVPSPQPGTQRGAPRREALLPTEPVWLAGALLHGNRSASVALIEYSDFECPYCGTFARETLPALERKYIASGKVLFAFRHYPLPRHSFAPKAALAAECAADQGRFWDMHTQLFQEPRRKAEADLYASARALGLDRRLFEACLEAGTPKIQADISSGKTLGITGTPTFLLGHLRSDQSVRVVDHFTGAQPIAVFEAAIDQLLAPRVGRADR